MDNKEANDCNVAEANLQPKARQDSIYSSNYTPQKDMLEIESSDLGNALIYNYDQNSFCWRCPLI